MGPKNQYIYLISIHFITYHIWIDINKLFDTVTMIFIIIKSSCFTMFYLYI